VTCVIGNAHHIAASLFAPGNSIASTLANEFTEAVEPLYVSSLIELGLVLFVITYLVQVAAQFLLRRMYKSWSVGL
jgi:phosphate transport system permease protein